MSEKGKSAYITGGASGIGKAVAVMLAKKGINVILADQNLEAAKAVADELNRVYEKVGVKATSVACDVSNWDQQLQAFKGATLDTRIHYVFAIAGIGEKPWMSNKSALGANEYEKPNLKVLDVDLTGVLYTCSLAVQHFRRQEVDDYGFRGKIIVTSSVCGIYCVPTIPIYTAAKHGVIGFTRTYGRALPAEKITLNAVLPNIVETAISQPAFYAKMKDLDLLVPMATVTSAFENFLGEDGRSGVCLEAGPRGMKERVEVEYMDEESRASMEFVAGRQRGV